MLNTDMRRLFSEYRDQEKKQIPTKELEGLMKKWGRDIKAEHQIERGDHQGSVWLKENAPLLLESGKKLHFSNKKINVAYFYCIAEFLKKTDYRLSKENLLSFYSCFTETFHPSEDDLAELPCVFLFVLYGLIRENSKLDRTEMPRLFQCFHEFRTVNLDAYSSAFSPLDEVLRFDPSGHYKNMTKQSQAIYKECIKREAARSKKTAETLAKEKLLLANKKGGHVGSFLKKEKIWIYPCVPIAIVFLYLFSEFSIAFSSAFLAFLAFLISVPLYFFVRDLIHFILSISIKAEPLPAMKIDCVDEKNKTCVVITSLIQNENDVNVLCHKLQQYKANNADQNDQIYFGLLCDFKESKQKIESNDQKLIDALHEKISSLNRSHPFYFAVVRKRTYHKSEGKFVGWERKRGAIEEFVSYLCGNSWDDVCLIGMCDKIVGSEYIITLDADTRPSIDQVKRLIGYASHPLNAPKIEKLRGRWQVTDGHGILQPKIAPSLLEKIKTPFGKMIGNGSGNIFYASASYDHMQYFHNESNFCGKGLICVNAYQKVINGVFPEQRILSHDMPEGALLRCGLLTNEYFSDSNPQSAKSFYQRQHRWIRGDVQNLKIFNLLSPFRKSIYIESTLRYFVPLFEFLLLSVSSAIGGRVALACICMVLLFHAQNLLFTFTALFLSGNLETAGRRFSTKIRNVIYNGFFHFVYSLSAISFEAYYYSDAILRALYRTGISKKKTLEWQVYSPFSSSKNGNLFFLPSIATAMVSILLSGSLFSVLIFLLWCLFPVICQVLSVPYPQKTSWNQKDRSFLLEKAKNEFLFFERCVSEKTFYLPPDNIQIEPSEQIAMRTSPTNIGLYLASLVGAWEMGIIREEDFVLKLKNSYSTVEKLERWKGHLYNWYDLNTLQVIGDRSVSTVDSGNYVACLVVVVSALKKARQTDEVIGMISKMENEIHHTDFRALYHAENNLFRVAVRPDSDEKYGSDYDLYMSEARITAFLAIALGKVPIALWSSLKRPLLSFRGRVGIASWTGTAFEYFMAPLFLPVIENSMEDESLEYALYCQKKYGAYISPNKKVYGISESGFSLQDEEERYQYKAFGVPYLSTVQEKNIPKVISPYSSFLFLERKNQDVIENLKLLSSCGMEGDFGYYEAMEFHSGFLGDRTRISSYMAHHKGMSILALTNACCDDVIQKHFLSFEEFSSKIELLAERFPIEGKIQKKKSTIELPQKKASVKEQVYDLTCTKNKGNLVSDGKNSMLCFDDGSCRVLRKGCDLFVSDSIGVQWKVKTDSECLNFSPRESVGGRVRFYQNKTEYQLQKNRKKICISYELLGGKSSVLLHAAMRGFNEKAELQMIFDACFQNEKEYASHPAFQALSLEGKKEGRHFVIRKRGIDQHRYLHLFCSDNFSVSIQGKTLESDFSYRMLLNPRVIISVLLNNAENRNLAFILVASETESAEDPFLLLDGSFMMSSENQKRSLMKIESSNQLCFFDEKCRKTEQRILASAIHGRSYYLLDHIQNLKKDWLWKFGISGDYPFVFANADMENEKAKESIGVLLCVAKHIIMSGIALDFVFVQKENTEYFNPSRDEMTDLISRYQCGFLIGKHPGIHVISTNSDERNMFMRTAAFSYQNQNSFELLEKEESAPIQSERIHQENAETVGRFIENGFEINKDVFDPTEPFSHIISNRVCGFVCNQNSLGYTWHRNAGLNRISKWDNVPTRNDGEKIYLDWQGLRYDLLQIADKVTWKRHFAIYEGTVCNEKFRIIATISERVSAKIIWVELSQSIDENAHLVFSFIPSLGQRAEGNIAVCKSFDVVRFAPMISSEYDGTAYFFHQDGIERIARDQNRISIHVKGKKENLFFFGGYHGEAHFDFLCQTLRKACFEDLLSKEKEFSDQFFSKIASDDVFWIRYQTVHSRFFGRTGLYQSSGAYGFRDQLQDSLAFLSFSPEHCKMQILRSASHQFADGDVQHWWHPVSNGNQGHPGIRSRCSDDYLWLLFACSEYINRTGDGEILNCKAPFLAAEALKPMQSEAYLVPKKEKSEPILEHLKRAVLLFMNRKTGPNGLPDIGTGDWNDGMNRLDGESVWLGFFGALCLNRVSEYFDPELKAKIREYLSALLQSLEKSFNGCWFPRVFCSDGRILGNDPTLEEECSIDLITQAFSGLCASEIHSMDYQLAKKAMESAFDVLVDFKNNTVKLFTKPFVDSNPSPGYIQRYVAGVRENGGQYTHAAVFLALAFVRLGDRYNDSEMIQKGEDLSKLLDPTKYLSKASYEKYRREPYVLCGDVYTAKGMKGHGGWSWYTGAAGWYHQLLSEIQRIKSKRESERI